MHILRNLFLILFIHTRCLYSQDAETYANLEHHPLLSLIADSPDFSLWDTPVIAPDGKSLAWTIREKPPESYYDPSAERENPINFLCLIERSTIFVKSDDSSSPIEISVPGKSCWGPSWSPDGNFIAYYSNEDGNITLWIYDLNKKSSFKTSSIPLNPDPIKNLLWSSNSEEVYALTPSKLSLEKIKISNPKPTIFNFKSEEKNRLQDFSVPSDLISINIKNGTSSDIILFSELSLMPVSLTLSPSGKWITYSSVQQIKKGIPDIHGYHYEIGVISADGKVRHKLADSLPLGFNSLVKYLWHPFSDKLFFLADQKVWIVEFSEKGISSSPLTTLSENVDSSTLAITKCGEYLVAGLDSFDIQDHSGEHATKLAMIPLKDKSPIKIFNLPKNCIFGNLIANDSGILWQPSTDSVALKVKNKGNRTLRSILQLNLKTGDPQILWEGNGNMNPIGFTNDHQKLYAFFQDFNTPKEIFAFDRLLNPINAISNIHASLKQIEVGTFELFESMVPKANGKMEKVQSAIILPPGSKRGDQLPAIVVHYPGADCSLDISQFGGGDGIGGMPQWLLVNHGFAVILPNLVLEEAIGNPLQIMTDRLLPQVHQAADLGYINLNRVGILGQSYGGYGTAGIISHTSLFRAAVATNGIYDLPSFTHHLALDGTNYWMTWAEQSQGRMEKYLFEDLSRYIDNSPFYRADKIFTPLLLIHGSLDVASYPDACKMFSALRRLDRSVELVVYKNGWHIINEMSQKDHLDASKRILDYFHRYLRK